MRKLLAPLAVLALALPAEAAKVIPLHSVRHVSLVGSQMVIADGQATYLTQMVDVVLDPALGNLTLTGPYSAIEETVSSERTSSYVDKDGVTHVIHTPCKTMSADPCTAVHRAHLESHKKAYPPKPVD